MNFLFIHQNFPGQFCHLASKLAEEGHQVVGLGINEADKNKPLSEKVKHVRYKLHKGTTKEAHHLVKEIEAKTIRGEACAIACNQLKDRGFRPDLIYGHPGWGELLFIKTVWPDVPLICFQEYFYNEEGFDCNFDLEFARERDFRSKSMLIMKNAYLYMTLEQADWNVCPTHFQASTYPDKWKNKFSVIHDGINTDVVKPAEEPVGVKLKDGTKLTKKNDVITFINRRLEPYRGVHTMIRAIPQIQKKNPKAHIVIMGDEKGTSYGAACEKGEWKDKFLKEIKGQYDPSRVHFTGAIPYNQYLKILQISSAHVYLTYPFVLSWSLMEAMAVGCPIIGSDTAPIREIIQHGYNGVLFDFFSPNDLCDSVTDILKHKELGLYYGKNARQDILDNYDLKDCIDKQVTLIKMVQQKNLML